MTMPGEGSSSLRATYSPDGEQLAVAESFMQLSYVSSGSTMDIPDQSNPTPISIRPLGPSMFFSADLKLLDARTGELKLKLSSSQPGRAMFSPDGELIAAWNANEVKLWNARTGREAHNLKGFKGLPRSIAFSPDGKLLAVASTAYDHRGWGSAGTGRSEVKLFDVRTWNVKLRLTNLASINSLAFNPSGRVLLIGGTINEKAGAIPGVKLFDLQTGNAANLIAGGEDFSEAVDYLMLSRSGSLLAFRSGTATVKMLDT